MNPCPRCGAPTEPDQHFCTRCGLRLNGPKAAQPEFPIASASGGAAVAGRLPVSPFTPSATPYFIWSLVLFLLLNPIGAPLALAALFYTIEAHAGHQSFQAIEKARLLCLVSTVITGATIFLLACALYGHFSA